MHRQIPVLEADTRIYSYLSDGGTRVFPEMYVQPHTCMRRTPVYWLKHDSRRFRTKGQSDKKDTSLPVVL